MNSTEQRTSSTNSTSENNLIKLINKNPSYRKMRGIFYVSRFEWLTPFLSFYGYHLFTNIIFVQNTCWSPTLPSIIDERTIGFPEASTKPSVSVSTI